MAAFSEAQQQQMAAIIAQAMTIVNQTGQQQQQQAQQQAPRPPQFRARDIGFFYPDPQAPAVEVKDTLNHEGMRQNGEGRFRVAALQSFSKHPSSKDSSGNKVDTGNQGSLLKQW